MESESQAVIKTMPGLGKENVSEWLERYGMFGVEATLAARNFGRESVRDYITFGDQNAFVPSGSTVDSYLHAIVKNERRNFLHLERKLRAAEVDQDTQAVESLKRWVSETQRKIREVDDVYASWKSGETASVEKYLKRYQDGCLDIVVRNLDEIGAGPSEVQKLPVSFSGKRELPEEVKAACVTVWYARNYMLMRRLLGEVRDRAGARVAANA